MHAVPSERKKEFVLNTVSYERICAWRVSILYTLACSEWLIVEEMIAWGGGRGEGI